MRKAVPFIIAVLVPVGCIIAMQNGIHINGQDGLFCLSAFLLWKLVSMKKVRE